MTHSTQEEWIENREDKLQFKTVDTMKLLKTGERGVSERKWEEQ